ncbi:hypothetical protein K9M06_03625 [Candidatus Bipolaricaulota bacterium]|nr:hypothetical protein [Candidatus Bipolaricaulota bacterium]
MVKSETALENSRSAFFGQCRGQMRSNYYEDIFPQERFVGKSFSNRLQVFPDKARPIHPRGRSRIVLSELWLTSDTSLAPDQPVKIKGRSKR